MLQQRLRRPREVDSQEPTHRPLLQTALGTVAIPAGRSKSICLAARYQRIAARRGHVKDIVRIEHTILVAI
jgi:hypothetical protein